MCYHHVIIALSANVHIMFIININSSIISNSIINSNIIRVIISMKIINVGFLKKKKQEMKKKTWYQKHNAKLKVTTVKRSFGKVCNVCNCKSTSVTFVPVNT